MTEVQRRHPVRFARRHVGDKPLQRSAAVGALVIGAAGVGFVGWYLANRPVLFVVLLLCALAALYFGFLALTTAGLRRWVAAGLAFVAAAGFVVGLVLKTVGDDGVRWSGPIGLVLLGLAAVLARYALRVDLPAADTVWAVPRHGPTTRRGVLVVNPRSGRGGAIGDDFEALARAHGVEIVVLGEDDDPGVMAERAIESGADAVGMAGGDGSLGVVARVCVGHDVPFVCVPAGTRNHFALDLGLDRDDPSLALAAFVNGEEHRIDYGEVNGRFFLNNVSLGGYAAAVAQPGYRDAKVETALAVIPDLVGQGGPWFDLRFEVPGVGWWQSAALLQVSNGVYDMAGPNLGRRFRLDEGVLGIVAVDVDHAGDLVTLAILAAARHPERSAGVWPWTAETFRVESGQRSVGVGVDGEYVELEPPLEFRSHPRGLRVLVPAGTPVGFDAQHLGARGTVSGLFEVAFTATPARGHGADGKRSGDG